MILIFCLTANKLAYCTLIVATGNWQLATGYWLLVTGKSLQIVILQVFNLCCYEKNFPFDVYADLLIDWLHPNKDDNGLYYR